MPSLMQSIGLDADIFAPVEQPRTLYDLPGPKFFRKDLQQAARRGIVGREAVTE